MNTITILIKPFNEQYCGHCPMLIAWKFGTSFGCRLFTKGFGGKNRGLKMSKDGSNERHPACIKYASKPNLTNPVYVMETMGGKV